MGRHRSAWKHGKIAIVQRAPHSTFCAPATRSVELVPSSSILNGCPGASALQLNTSTVRKQHQEKAMGSVEDCAHPAASGISLNTAKEYV